MGMMNHVTMKMSTKRLLSKYCCTLRATMQHDSSPGQSKLGFWLRIRAGVTIAGAHVGGPGGGAGDGRRICPPGSKIEGLMQI